MNYKLIQITNNNVGIVAANANIPVGNITRKISCNNKCCTTFDVTSSTSDTVTLNEPGYYKITYSASLIAEAVGEVSVGIISNGAQVYEVGENAAAVSDVVNLTAPFVVRVFGNCQNLPSNCPMTIQFENTGVAVTGGNANILIEKVY